jgi:hypothetical protein
MIHAIDDDVPAEWDLCSIQITALNCALVNGDLRIGDIGRSDNIAVNPSRDGPSMVVLLNRAMLGTFLLVRITGRLFRHGIDGVDQITISPKIVKPINLFGDAGDDSPLLWQRR